MNNALKNKAQWIADLMKADGVKPEQVTPEMALAYMEQIGRKIEMIQNKYLTNSAARQAMQLNALVGLK